jgi:hypothetical protein
MKANNFNERKGWSVLDGKHGKWQKIYASNGILEVADLLDKFRPVSATEYRFL